MIHLLDFDSICRVRSGLCWTRPISSKHLINNTLIQCSFPRTHRIAPDEIFCTILTSNTIRKFKDILQFELISTQILFNNQNSPLYKFRQKLP